MDFQFLSKISAVLFLALSAGAVFVGFSVCFLLSVFKIGYGLKKRAWFLILVALFGTLLRARANIVGEKDFSPLLFCFGLALALLLYFVRVRAVKNDDEDRSRRDFVRFLDGKIKNTELDYKQKPSAAVEDGVQTRENTEELFAMPQIPTQKETSPAGLDFSHVKNVLQRLEPALLSYADRRQIHELELALFSAERGDNSAETKSKINEGLGNLLKIMARHGV